MKNIFRKTLVSALILGIVYLSLIPNISFAGGCVLSSGEILKPLSTNPDGSGNCASYGSSAKWDANATPGGNNILKSLDGCSWWRLGFSAWDCVLIFLAYTAYGIFYVVGFIVGIAGNIFSFTLGLTIDNSNYAAIPAIQEGWQFTRDVTNIFFIFALLFIAIATILGLEGYGAKNLLAKLIIIALLVNFSLLATQAIIYITNALSYELYQTIAGDESTLMRSQTGSFRYRDIGGAIYAATSQQSLYKSTPQDLGSVNAVSTPQKNSTKTNLAVFVTIVTGIFIMILAAFIFLAGAFFFIVRMAMLWLLMVVAPFGFVFLILPATKGFAQKWWSTLQSQALFAPAFIFFIAITVKITKSGPLLALANSIKGQQSTTTELLFLVILQSVIVFILLGASLIVAKTLGIYGAGAAIGMAQKGGAWMRGYAGQISKRAAVTATAPAASAVSRSWAGRIPIIGGTSRALSAAGRKSVEDYQKGIEKYTTRELKQMIGGPRVQPTQSVAIMQELVKRGDVSIEHGLTETKMRGVHAQMQRQNMNTRDLERLWPELAVTPEQAAQVRQLDTGQRMNQIINREGPEYRIFEAARRMRPADIEKLDVSVVNQQHSIDAIAAAASSSINQKFVERGGDHFTALENAYRRLAVAFAASRGKIITEAEVAYGDVAAALDRMGNRAGANFFRKGTARRSFNFRERSTGMILDEGERELPLSDDYEEIQQQRPPRPEPEPRQPPPSEGGQVRGFRGTTTQ